MSTSPEPMGREKLRAVFKAIAEATKEAFAEMPPGPHADALKAMAEFRVSITAETDRGAALMSAAYLDEQLKRVLVARLVDNKKLSRRALEFNGPLGTFSSRIDFSYLLGVLPKNAHQDLHAIRSIRNKFAHEPASLDFENEKLKPLCEALKFHGVKSAASPASKFRRSVMGLLRLILYSMDELTHIEPAPEAEIEDRTDAYKFFAKIWEEHTGQPYPLKHEHE